MSSPSVEDDMLLTFYCVETARNKEAIVDA